MQYIVIIFLYVKRRNNYLDIINYIYGF